MTNPTGQIPMRARIADIAGIYARAQQALEAELSIVSPGTYSGLAASRAKRGAERIVGDLNASAQRWAADPAVARAATIDFAHINFGIFKQATRYLAAAGLEVSVDPETRRLTPLISSRILKGMTSGQLGARVEWIARERILEARIEAVAAGRRHRVIITGKESHASLLRLLAAHEQAVINGLLGSWREQADLISEHALRQMLASGRPDPQLLESLKRMNRTTVRDDVMARAARGMTDSSLDIETRVRLMFKELFSAEVC